MKRLLALGGLAALLLSACAKEPNLHGDAPEYAEAALEPFPGAKVKYYLVEGTDPQSISASIRDRHLADQPDGNVAAAVTRWETEWRLPTGPDGRCDLSRLELDVKVTVTLPQLANENVPPALKQRWGNFMAGLVAHEGGHVRYAYDYKDKIYEAMQSASCDAAKVAGQRVLEELNAVNVRYDAETRNGETQSIYFAE